MVVFIAIMIAKSVFVSLHDSIKIFEIFLLYFTSIYLVSIVTGAIFENNVIRQYRYVK